MSARLVAQLIAGDRATSVLGVLDRCLALQTQELRAGYLNVRARSTGLSVADVHEALDSRAAVVTWVNRGTLHLVRAEDYGWLHALTTPQLVTANVTRLRQEGVSPAQADKAMPLLKKALADGPMTRAQLRDVLDRRGIPTAAQAMVHLLFKATLAGLVVRGPMVGNEQGWVLVADWLGRQPKVDRAKALRELGVRYAASHVPSDERDLAKWAGITLGDARAALAGVTFPPYEEVPAPPTLLGPWDELLCGWSSRDWVLDGAAGVVTVNGIFKPTALVKGRAVGTWNVTTGAVEPFAPLTPAVTRALERDYADVRRFLDRRT